jgi:hypothetical protein
MGELALPNQAARDHVMAMARRTVMAEEDDEASPKYTWEDGTAMDPAVALVRISQLLVLTRDLMQPVCAEISASSGPIGPAVSIVLRSRNVDTDEARRIAATIIRCADQAEAGQ